jgi:hypothetical protein
MKCFGKTHHKPHFPYRCINFSFLLDFFDFWSIGAEGDVVMDTIYKIEKNKK